MTLEQLRALYEALKATTSKSFEEDWIRAEGRTWTPQEYLAR